MAWLLDTNILSEGRKPRPHQGVKAVYDREPLDGLYISILGIAEIRFSIELQQGAVRRAALPDWLTLTLRPTFAGRHPDLVIAATPLHYGFTVVTRDRSDFDKARDRYSTRGSKPRIENVEAGHKGYEYRESVEMLRDRAQRR